MLLKRTSSVWAIFIPHLHKDMRVEGPSVSLILAILYLSPINKELEQLDSTKLIKHRYSVGAEV